MPEKEKDSKEKDSKEKDSKEKDSKEKESKEKTKAEKDKEKKTPKPRLSTGAAAVPSEQSPKSDSSVSGSLILPSTPKQRGRKPSTVKTPTESPSSSKTTPETQKPPSIPGNSPGRSPLPGLVPLLAAPVPSSSSFLTGAVKDPLPMTAGVLVPEMLPKTVASQLQELPQPSTSVLVPEIAKQMDVDMPPTTTVPKQASKQATAGTKQATASNKQATTSNKQATVGNKQATAGNKQATAGSKQATAGVKQATVGNTAKKRAAPKASDEPKRKVGRPPIKKKPDTPSGSRKTSAQASPSNTVTSPLNTAFSSTFPQDSQGTPTSMPAFATFSSQNMFTGNNQGSSVPQNGPRTPSPNAYMIPQPRNRGLLENGHVQRPNNVSQGPL